jgi:hypothetical protein
MLLEQIVLDVVAQSTTKLSLDDIVIMVRAHRDYEGSASPGLLKRQVEAIVTAELRREKESEPDLKPKLLGFEDKIALS